MTAIDDLFPSKYLKASDVGEDGKVFTISHLKKEDMKSRDGAEEKKPVIFFHEVEKGVVLNRTNAKVIASLYGDDYSQWAGKKVMLYSDKVDAFGEMKDAIRIKPKVPAGAASNDPTEGLYANTSALHPDTVKKWTALVKEGMAAGVVMNYSLDETDTGEVLKTRVAALKQAIADNKAKADAEAAELGF